MLAKLRKNYPLIISTFLIIYFLVNLFGGERGLFSYFEKKRLLVNLQNEETEITKKIKDLEFKNSLLTNNLDLDYVEILLRKKFLLGKKDEKFYIIEKYDN